MTTDEGSILAKTVAPAPNGSAILANHQPDPVKAAESSTPKLVDSATSLELASNKEPAAESSLPVEPALEAALPALPTVHPTTAALVSGCKQEADAEVKLNAQLGEENICEYDKVPAPQSALIGVLLGLACSLVGFAMLAFALVITRQPEEVVDASSPCESDMCQEALHFLTVSGDMTVNPCHDFYRYVCHRWTDNGSFIGDVMADFYALLDGILTPGYLPYPDVYGSHVFFHTYRACLGFMNTSEENASPVLPRLQKYAASLQHLPPSKLVTAIAALSGTAGIDVLFGVGLQFYGNRTYPALTSGRSLRKKFEGLPNFTSYLEAAVALMTTETPAKSLVADLLELDDAVDAAFRNDTDTRLLNISSIPELIQDTGASTWSSLFQQYAGALDTEEFLWTGPTQMKRIMEMIGKETTSSTVQVYLALQVAADVLSLYFKSRSSAGSTQLETRKTCLVAACRVSSHACSYQISRFLGLPPIAEGDAQALYDAVINAFSKNRGLVSWIDNPRWAAVVDIFRNTTVTLVHRLVRQLNNRSTKVYPNRIQSSDDFLDEYLTLIEAHKAASMAYPLPVDLAALAERQMEGVLVLNEPLKSVVVSGALLSAPVLYSATMPREFNFGTMGAMLARELAHVITPASSKDWWDRRSQEAFAESTKCLHGLHSTLEGSASGWDVATASNLFAWTMAARTAMDALLSGEGSLGSQIEGEPSNSKWPETSREETRDAMRTFFRRFCLLSCGRDEPRLSARSRCVIPLVGMAEFSEAFDCPLGSTMNPNASCALRFRDS
ncbi:membrane metallo-endopeptidase-like 1 [Amblyomma americanum]